jgi:hypothetical protein
MQKCVAFFIDKTHSIGYTYSMIKKILAFSILLSLGASPSFAIENGQKENNISRVVVLYWEQQPGCSGYLYEPRIVFTAAHCLIHAHLPTYVGLPNQTAGPNAEKVSIQDILFADQYNKLSPYENDFAILILSKPIEINNKIVLLNEEIKNKIYNGQVQAKISGYGYQSPSRNEAEIVRDAHFFYGTIVNISNEIEISNNGDGGVCSGDSGGPNTIIYEGEEVYLGATSHGWNQPNCGLWNGGGKKTLLFDPVYKHVSLIDNAKLMVASVIVTKKQNTVIKNKSTIKKKCIKLKNRKCKK